MPEQLQKNFLIDIQQKLYEQETMHGNLAVYQTSSFGMMLTINSQVVVSENDGFFFNEMMTHPALFTHHRPQKVAIIGNYFGILQEVLKHSSIKHVLCILNTAQITEVIKQYFPDLYQAKFDQRVKLHIGDPIEWVHKNNIKPFDVIIQTERSEEFLQEHFKNYFHALTSDGIFVQLCQSSLLQFKTLKPIFQNIRHAGFNDWQALNFPQPSYPSGWRTIMMATKHSIFQRIREKDIFNKEFSTRYYNFDTHKAALALPEFMRQELDMSKMD